MDLIIANVSPIIGIGAILGFYFKVSR